MSDSENKEPENQAVFKKADVDSSSASLPNWRSEQILKGCSEATIEHNNEIYRLRRTRNNRLILYK